MTKLTGTPTYTFPSGVTVNLQPIPAFHIFAARMSENGKPKPPVKEYTVRGKVKTEPNPTDPAYVEALELYETAKNYRFTYLLLTKSIVGNIEDYLEESVINKYEELAEGIFGEDFKDSDLIYTWVTDELIDMDVFNDFREKVQGLTTVTPSGVEESKSDS